MNAEGVSRPARRSGSVRADGRIHLTFVKFYLHSECTANFYSFAVSANRQTGRVARRPPIAGRVASGFAASPKEEGHGLVYQNQRISSLRS